MQPQQRRHSRRRALQALYQCELTGDDTAAVQAQFLARQDMSKCDLEYFAALLDGVAGERAALDTALAAHLDRSLDQVDPIERSILRLGAWELRERPDVPYRVIINEAVELAKLFGAEQGHKYVNGVLDALARELRAARQAPAAAGQ